MNFVFKRSVILLKIAVVMIFIAGCASGRGQTKSNYGGDSLSNDKYAGERYDEVQFDENNGSGKSGYRNRDMEDRKAGYRDSAAERRAERNDYGRYNRRDSEYTARNNDEYNNENRETFKERFNETGLASWYGREFHGKVTASGEKFDMYQMTAAHKSLPFGTELLVKNLDNGRTVKVRVNDRGPYRGNRIIDLSYYAAKKLGMISAGKAVVGIKIMKKNSEESYGRNRYNENYRGRKKYIEPVVRNEYSGNNYEGREEDYDRRGEENSDNFAVQAGAFYSKRNALKLKEKIEELTRNPVILIHEGDLYKVRITGFYTRREAKRLKRILKSEEISSYILNRE